MHEMITDIEMPPPPTNEFSVAYELYNKLHIAHSYTTARLRIEDLRKNVEGCMHSLDSLREQCAVISETVQQAFHQSMQANTKNLEQVRKKGA